MHQTKLFILYIMLIDTLLKCTTQLPIPARLNHLRLPNSTASHLDHPPLFTSTHPPMSTLTHLCTPQPFLPMDTHQPPMSVLFNHPSLLMLFVSENCRMINFVAKRTASWAQMCGVVALMYSGKLLVRYNKLLIITNLHYKTVIF